MRLLLLLPWLLLIQTEFGRVSDNDVVAGHGDTLVGHHARIAKILVANTTSGEREGDANIK